ncbi:hypothetical protein D3C71_1917280 [compost metagenome]
MVVFLHDEHEAVEAGKLGVPCCCLFCSILFTEQRQFVIGDVDDLVISVPALVGDTLHPFSNLRT